MGNVRILRCEHCRVWYTVNRVVPDVCPYCEKSAKWKTAEAMEPEAASPLKPWKLTRDDRDFLRTNKIDPDGPDDDQDDGA